MISWDPIPPRHLSRDEGKFKVFLDGGIFQQITGLKNKAHAAAAVIGLLVSIQAQNIFVIEEVNAPGGM
jgi:hypothetical protein